MAGEDPRYAAWLRDQQCCVCLRSKAEQTTPTTCHHHTNRRATGRRAHDRDSFPLCIIHHAEFHDGKGHFREWDKPKRRAWQDRMCAEYRLGYHAAEGEDAFCREWDDIF